MYVYREERSRVFMLKFQYTEFKKCNGSYSCCRQKVELYGRKENDKSVKY